MRRDLIRRLERLESRLENVGRRVVLVWVEHRIEQPRRDALAENERIVCDLYREVGQCALARQRITTDPMDEGRKCPPRGYLADVIQELHKKCEWRDRGGCQDCRGLEHLFAPPDSNNLPQAGGVAGTIGGTPPS